MKEIVEQILKEEETGRQKVKQAKAQAEEIVRKARIESRETLEKTIAQAKDEQKQRKEVMTKEFLIERENALTQAKADSGAEISQKRRNISQLVKNAFARIIRIEQ